MHDVYEQNGMKCKVLIVGMVSTNCYIVSNVVTKQAFIVDPGDSPEPIMKYVDGEGLTVEAVLLTHGHFDHIYGVEALCKKYDATLYAHEDEVEVLKDPVKNVSSMIGRVIRIDSATPVKDGQVLNIAGFDMKVLHTPGHTKGSCCYYCEKTKMLFSGDTLFEGSVGRTDFPTGSSSTIVKSICTKLAVLPDDVIVLSGHGGETSIGYEKVNNPFISGCEF